jgi:hypothetical protein
LTCGWNGRKANGYIHASSSTYPVIFPVNQEEIYILIESAGIQLIFPLPLKISFFTCHSRQVSAVTNRKQNRMNEKVMLCLKNITDFLRTAKNK